MNNNEGRNKFAETEADRHLKHWKVTLNVNIFHCIQIFQTYNLYGLQKRPVFLVIALGSVYITVETDHDYFTEGETCSL